MSLDTLILRPRDEGYIDPRSDAVQNQPILTNSGEDEFVDDPEILQKDYSNNQQEEGLAEDSSVHLQKDMETYPGEFHLTFPTVYKTKN